MENKNNYRVLLYFIKNDIEPPILLYGVIFPWHVDQAYLNIVTVRKNLHDRLFSQTKLKIYNLQFASTFEFCEQFFLRIKEISIKDFTELNFDKVKGVDFLLNWKLELNNKLFNDVFFEEDTNSNQLRDYRSWQNIIPLGSGVGKLYLNLSKSAYFKWGKDVFLKLNNFFEEELGIKLFDKNKENIFPSGEEWKRLGNLEFIQKTSMKLGKELVQFNFHSEKIIRFTIFPELTDKKFLGLNFQIMNYGLIHSNGFKIIETTDVEPIIVDMPIDNKLASTGYFQIYESTDGLNFKLLLERKVHYIKQFQFNLNLQDSLPQLKISKSSWNSFLSQVRLNEKNSLELKNSLQNESTTVKSKEKDFFSDLITIHDFLSNFKEDKKKNHSKFFDGTTDDKYQLALFIKDIVNELGIHLNNSARIYLVDPFGNEEAIRLFIARQSVPVEMIINTDQQREITEEDQTGSKNEELRSKIIATCLEYSNTIHKDSKIIDINRKSSPQKRSFHDRYIIIYWTNEQNEEIKGFNLSTSLSSYFSGTPSLISELDSATSSEVYRYITRLKNGNSKFTSETIDLSVNEIWPSSYYIKKESAIKTRNEIKLKLMECGFNILKDCNIQFQAEITNIRLDEKYSPFSLNISGSSRVSDFSAIIPFVEKSEIKVKDVFPFFNYFLRMTNSTVSSELSTNLYTSFLNNPAIKSKFFDYMKKWQSSLFPHGIKEEILTYDQFPKIQQNFRVYTGKPHTWIKDVSRLFDGSLLYNSDEQLNLLECYLENDPTYGLSIIEYYFHTDKFFQQIDNLNNKPLIEEKDVKSLQASARLGQLIISKLFCDIKLELYPSFIKALLNSEVYWLKQCGYLSFYLNRTFINDLTIKAFENTDFILENVSSEEKQSLLFSTYIKLIEASSIPQNTQKIIIPLEKIKKEFWNSVNSLSDEELLNLLFEFVFIFRVDWKVLSRFLDDKNLPISIKEKIIEEFSLRLIKNKIDSKLNDNKETNGYIIYEKTELLTIFDLIVKTDEFEDKIMRFIQDYHKQAERKIHNPFLKRKKLSELWHITEGLAWCIYYMQVFSFDLRIKKTLEELLEFSFDNSKGCYHDWPPFQLIKNNEL